MLKNRLKIRLKFLIIINPFHFFFSRYKIIPWRDIYLSLAAWFHHLGKGFSSASLAYLLQSRGYKVRLRKLDPYLNVDPGTMSPFQHGEVFVTDDGAETDLDLGHYERFSGVTAKENRQYYNW